MNIEQTLFPGLLVLKPQIHRDVRGYFFESFRSDLLKQFGLDVKFKQENQSESSRGVIRGLHYQLTYGQGKLVHCLIGSIFDVAMDIRLGSPTFGRVFTKILDDHDHHFIYIPPGFAHGFGVLSDRAVFQYKCTEYYHPEDEYGILWNDAGIHWPVNDPILSEKDLQFSTLQNQKKSLLPVFKE